MTTLVLSQPKSLMRLSDLALLLVAVVWGTSYGVAKGALAFYPVLGFLAVRFILTFAVLLPALLRTAGQPRHDALRIGLPPVSYTHLDVYKRPVHGEVVQDGVRLRQYLLLV